MTLPIEDEIFHADIEQLNRHPVLGLNVVGVVMALAGLVFAADIMNRVMKEMETGKPESAFSRSKAVLARVKKGTA